MRVLSTRAGIDDNNCRPCVCQDHANVFVVALYVLDPHVGNTREGESSNEEARNTEGGRAMTRVGRGKACCVIESVAVED